MDTNLENRTIEIGEESLKHLNTTRKWAMFFAIIGFIILGLFITFGLIAGTFLSVFKSGAMGSGFPQILIFAFIIVLALVYFFPILFLFRFSKHTANAVQTLSKEELHKAFKNLKSYFIYLGVLVIIGLSFYVVALVIAGSSIALLKGM